MLLVILSMPMTLTITFIAVLYSIIAPGSFEDNLNKFRKKIADTDTMDDRILACYMLGASCGWVSIASTVLVKMM